MFSSVYQNNDIDIRRDLMEDGIAVRDVLHLLEIMENDIDAPDVVGIDEGACNAGAFYFVTLRHNGDISREYSYVITPYDVLQFNLGETVRLYAGSCE